VVSGLGDSVSAPDGGLSTPVEDDARSDGAGVLLDEDMPRDRDRRPSLLRNDFNFEGILGRRKGGSIPESVANAWFVRRRTE